MGNVRTAVLRVPHSVFTFEDLSFGALNDEVKNNYSTLEEYIAVASSSVVLDLNGMSEDVAERRGRMAWPEGVAARRGRKAWPKGVVGRRACRNPGREAVGSLWFAARPFGVRMNVARACTITVTYNTVLCEFSRLQPQTSPSGFGVGTLMSASNTVMMTSPATCVERAHRSEPQELFNRAYSSSVGSCMTCGSKYLPSWCTEVDHWKIATRS